MADFNLNDFGSFRYYGRIGKFETNIAKSKLVGSFDLLVSVDYISNENIKNGSFEHTPVFTKMVKDNIFNDDYDYDMCNDITKLCGVFEILSERGGLSEDEKNLKNGIAEKIFFSKNDTLDREDVNKLYKKAKKYISKEELAEKKKQGEELGKKEAINERNVIKEKMHS